MPYHEVRARFLGNIATPKASASPMSVVKGLWGELPAFEIMEAVNALLDILVNRFWNSLTRHQKRSEPFRLIRTPVEPTRAGLAACALMRRKEIDGFVEGLFNGQEEVDLPEKATVSMGVLGELRAMCRSRLDQSLTTASRGGRKQDISLGAICGAGGRTMPGSPRGHYELFDARYLDRASPKRSKGHAVRRRICLLFRYHPRS